MCIHGYGVSSAIFVNCYEMLASCTSYDIFVFPDLSAMGTACMPYTGTSMDDAIDFFVDPLEHVRRFLGIQNCGFFTHSFGSYVAAQYIQKYSSLLVSEPIDDESDDVDQFHVHGMMLCSPYCVAGVKQKDSVAFPSIGYSIVGSALNYIGVRTLLHTFRWVAGVFPHMWKPYICLGFPGLHPRLISNYLFALNTENQPHALNAMCEFFFS